jgi:hypothetical protein
MKSSTLDPELLAQLEKMESDAKEKLKKEGEETPRKNLEEAVWHSDEEVQEVIDIFKRGEM